MPSRLAALALVLAPFAASAQPPEAAISNGLLSAKIYLPDAKTGYYRGTRFDWSGVVRSLVFQGHDFYGPWYQDTRPAVRDFIYEGPKVITGAASSVYGPVEEFFTGTTALGFEEAKAGGTFIKIGVGRLRKPDDKPYDHYLPYEIVDPGKWTVRRHSDSVEFTQQLKGTDGYSYTYTKSVRLVPGAPRMTIAHSLRNTGTKTITASTYNHNFTVVDGHGPKPGDKLTAAFDLRTPAPLENDLASVEGRSLVYRKPVEGEARVFTLLQGYSRDTRDFDFRLETAAGPGYRVTADQPVSRAMFWSIRSVISVEPYIDLKVEPGRTVSWTLTYDYFVK